MDNNNSFSIERPLSNVPSFISKWTKATAIRGLLLEFFGTAYYTYGISCSKGDPLLIAFSLFTPILFFIDFSGAFFNPAITIVKVIKPNPKMPLFLGILYIAVQIFGALFSGLLSYCLLNESSSPYISSEQSLAWSFSGFFGETIGTFIFAMIILIQTTEETRLTEDRIWGPFIIMIGFMVGRAYTFQTGGCLNPGIALGLEVFEAMRYDDAGRMKYLWLYILAPILGGLLALWFFLKLYVPYYLQKKQTKVVDLFGFKKERKKNIHMKEMKSANTQNPNNNINEKNDNENNNKNNNNNINENSLDISSFNMEENNLRSFLRASHMNKRKSKSIDKIHFEEEEKKNDEISIDIENIKET